FYKLLNKIVNKTKIAIPIPTIIQTFNLLRDLNILIILSGAIKDATPQSKRDITRDIIRIAAKDFNKSTSGIYTSWEKKALIPLKITKSKLKLI
ncbi:MAG: hypothetical protein ACLRS3_05445, partial [Veillonella parvula]